MGAFYRRIWTVTWRQQILLIILSVLVAAIAAAPLKLQQDIINHLVTNEDAYILFWYCLAYLGVIAASAGLKFAQAFYTRRLGEWTVRLMRNRLYAEAVEHGLPSESRGSGRGTLVNVLSAEAEAVGTFAGAAISAPVMQIGIMISVISFIAANQPVLGLVAAAVILPQLVIVLVTQGRINVQVKQRTRLLRKASNHVSVDDLKSVNEEVTSSFNEVYEVRIRNFKLKLSSKFLQSVISGIGAAAILFFGGLYVMQGKADTGIVVASLSGLARLNGPWRELVAIYRMASAMNVNFEMIMRQFPTLTATR